MSSRRTARRMSCGDASEGEAAGKAMLRKAALALANRIEPLDDLAADIHDLRIRAGAQTRERVVQDRRRPGGIERRLLDLVERFRLLEVGIGARDDEGIVAFD